MVIAYAEDVCVVDADCTQNEIVTNTVSVMFS